jgi:anti-sigma factor RsiW
MTAPIDDAELAALADGELAADAAARLEAEIAGDAALAARLARIRALRRAIAAAYDDTLGEAPPERLQAAIRGDANVIDLSAARQRRLPPVVRWGGLAASLALAFLAGRTLIRDRAADSWPRAHSPARCRASWPRTSRLAHR